VKISIVIPVINEVDQIRTAVERAWSSGADDVIVADGGSTDGTLERLQDLECQLINSKPGRAVQMNTGAQASQAEAIVFLHADNWLVDEACDQVRSALRNPDNQFGAFKQRIDNSRRIFRWIESGNQWRAKRMGLIYGDQAMFIRRSRFVELGGFPEIPLMEDFEFSRSLSRSTKPVILQGPTYVGARRWEKVGPVRQTVRNWILSSAFRMGVSPDWIAKRYRRHDQ